MRSRRDRGPTTSSSTGSTDRCLRTQRAISDNRAVNAIIVLCTCPDVACADRLATALVDERLAACVNRIGGVASTYRWQGSVQRSDEVLLMIKSTRERFDVVRERIVALHPYDNPEIVALAIEAGSAAYLDWIESSVDARGI